MKHTLEKELEKFIANEREKLEHKASLLKLRNIPAIMRKKIIIILTTIMIMMMIIIIITIIIIIIIIIIMQNNRKLK